VLERRANPRINELFDARVWGVDVAGNPFCVDCSLYNMSATGLYLRTPVQMAEGCPISVAVWLSKGPASSAVVGLRGRVLRNEPQPDDGYGIAVVITHHEFL
jgi:hypothetical protein